MEGWAGKLIVVYPTQADFGGQMVCTAGSYSAAEANKDVGCSARATGSGQTCRSIKPASAAPPEPEADPDLDDEIPW